MENKLTFGLRNVHYSIATETEEGWSFDVPKRLIGAQELSTELIGGKNDVYADDVVIGTLISNAGKNVTLTFTEITNDFKIDILGWKEDNNKNLVEIANAPVVPFALGFEIQGDSKARKTWFYLCSASPINESSKTKSDSIEANSLQLNITARPIEIDDKLVLKTVATTDSNNYEDFFIKPPTLPNFSNDSESEVD